MKELNNQMEGDWLLTNNCNFMKRKKKRSSEISITIFTILAVAIPIISLIWLLSFRNELNQYENQIKFFDDRYICSATYHDTSVILAHDNQVKLQLVLADYHGKLLLKKPNVTDSVNFLFTKENVDWNLTISQTDANYLKVDLVGSKEYHFYMQEDDYFTKIVKIASPDGWDVPNKVMKN